MHVMRAISVWVLLLVVTVALADSVWKLAASTRKPKRPSAQAT